MDDAVFSHSLKHYIANTNTARMKGKIPNVTTHAKTTCTHDCRSCYEAIKASNKHLEYFKKSDKNRELYVYEDKYSNGLDYCVFE